MRTTLTLDKDVAAALKRLQKQGDKTFKALVNEALRHGIEVLGSPPKRRKPYRTPPLDAGKCLLENVDNIAEVLSIIEGEGHR